MVGFQEFQLFIFFLSPFSRFPVFCLPLSACLFLFPVILPAKLKRKEQKKTTLALVIHPGDATILGSLY